METERELQPIKLIEDRLGKKIAAAMAAAFLDDTRDISERIGKCVSDRDSAGLRLLTHKLAGCSASIMDKDTHNLCRSLEDQGDDQSWEQTEPTYKSLTDSLERTREALRDYLKRSEST